MPAGTPLPAKARTSSEVKSGRRKRSFSKARGHGRRGSSSSARLTSSENLADISLLTTATKPSNSPLEPAGSLYVSMKPMYLRKAVTSAAWGGGGQWDGLGGATYDSTTGPTSLIQKREASLWASREPVVKLST